ncbi:MULTISPECIES: hypothetical protein [Terrabacteria group]|uniref:hypothetical protein n=1 Tax=Bacillati TaxID=1783272 RepID=UPI0019393949|nr:MULTISPECIES: hypothetical protein [Terrabacteria group]MBW9212742.1 hypothetical protein [Trueperella sp. zg.1013]QRG86571.1 hypothetical protein JOS54_06955 [Bulleidia sp. zg-1006]
MKKITVLLLTAVMLIGFAPTKVLACDDCSTGTIDDALAHRNYPSKRTFATRTRFQCEESNMGSRGWVHRYKMIDYYVY